jgi:hypothetical protein
MPFSLRPRYDAVILILLCLGTSSQAQAPNQPFSTRRPLRTGHAAADLYAAILDSAETATGSLHVGLSPFEGRTSSSRFGQAGVWRIEAGTTARIDFSLRGETWQTLTVDLSDHPLALQLAVDTPQPGFLRIAKITYGRDGAVRDLYEPGGTLITGFVPRGSSSGTSIGFYSDLLSNIKIVPQMSALLGGKNPSSRPFVFSSVNLLVAQGDKMSMTLRSLATLPLGDQVAGRCDPDLTFRESVPVFWRALSYDYASGRLEGTIGDFVTGLSGGCVAAGGTELKIVSGTQLNVTGLEFSQPARSQDSHIWLKASSFRGGFSAGSGIVLGSVSGKTTLLTAAQSGTLQADSLEIGVQESGKSVLAVGNAQAHLSAVSGDLAFDDTDFLQFSTSDADVTLASATWADSALPQVKGLIAPAPLTVAGGLLTFSPVTRLLLATGSAVAGSLAIDTATIPQIVGSFSAADVKIAAGSSLGAPGKFSLQLASGGYLQVRAPYQLTFAAESPGAQGGVVASAPVAMGEIDFDRGGRASIASGQIQFSLANSGSGLSGTIGGQLAFGAGTLPLGGTALAAVSQGSAQFDALSFTSAVGLSGPLTGLSVSFVNPANVILSPSFALSTTAGSILENLGSGQPTAISPTGITGGLKLHAGFTAGAALFAAGGNFVLGGGQIDGALVRSEAGLITGAVALSTDVAGGSLPLDSITTLPLGAGSHMEGLQLQLNDGGRIVGSVNTAHFVLASGTKIAAVRGRTLTLADHATYDLPRGGSIQFSESDPLPTGGGQLVATFSQLVYHDTPGITLRDGEVDADVSRKGPGDLQWSGLVVKGNQAGSYQKVTELPTDEYSVILKSPSGTTEKLVAPNRVMVVDSIPIAVNSTATFDDVGYLANAILAADATVFDIPLLGGTAVEVNGEKSMVLAGTIGKETTIDGVPYSKGCLAHLPPTSSDKLTPPCELVTTLAVRIKTSNDLLAGANDPFTGKPDDIWLDIGPKAWMISGLGDFSRGATTTINLDPTNFDGGDCSALTPGNVSLYVGDIVKVRVEKKGISLPKICGVAEGPDSLVDIGVEIPITPSAALSDMQAQIQVQRQALQIAHDAIDTLAQEVGKLQQAINDADAIIDQGSKLTQKVADVKNAIANVQRQITDAVLKGVDKICHNETISVGVCILDPPSCLVTRFVCAVNPEFQRLNDRVAQLENDLNNAQADVAGFAIRLDAAIATKTTDFQLETDKQITLKANQVAFDAATAAFNVLNSAASDLKDLIDHVLPGISIPLPGQWKPDSITLVVNGRDYATFPNNYGRLRQGHSEWENRVRTPSDGMSDGEYFVQGLRVNITKSGCTPTGIEKECGWDTFLTTPFAKMHGFSGWDDLKLGDVTVTGVLRHNPSPGEDAYVSFDLEVRSVDVGGRSYVLGAGSSIRSPRYVRIEYLHGTDERFDSSQENWKAGDTLRVTGPAKRDRDRTTFFEIHPLGSSNVSRIAQ